MTPQLNKRIVNGYEITNNLFNGGIQCTFEFHGEKYWADLAYVNVCGEYITECMIFGFNADGTTNWGELYCNRHIPFTDKSLVNEINEFKKKFEAEY